MTTLKLDASALVQSACCLRYKLIVIDGYTDKLPYNDTQYGSAFHKFAATIAETKGDIGMATHAALEVFHRPCEVRDGKKHLTDTHLLKTCFDYWEWFKKNDNSDILCIDGKPLVEVDFAIEVYRDDDLVVQLAGTADKIVKIKNGCYAIGDYKTHSLWKAAGNPRIQKLEAKKFFQTFVLSTQLRFYTYCLKIEAAKHPDTELGKILSTPIGTFIDGVFISGKDPTFFERSEVFQYSDSELAVFHKLVQNKVFQLVNLFKQSDYDTPDGIAQGSCFEMKFPCRFTSYCCASEPAIKKIILEQNFTKKPYNPLMFGK